jgi:hypothetical protein
MDTSSITTFTIVTMFVGTARISFLGEGQSENLVRNTLPFALAGLPDLH